MLIEGYSRAKDWLIFSVCEREAQLNKQQHEQTSHILWTIWGWIYIDIKN